MATAMSLGCTATQWSLAPYTEADLESQITNAGTLYGAEGEQVVTDVKDFVAGINAYIAEALSETAIRDANVFDPGSVARLLSKCRAQAAAGYTRDLMCARTIGVYEELLFPEPGAAVITQPERLSIVA